MNTSAVKLLGVVLTAFLFASLASCASVRQYDPFEFADRPEEVAYGLLRTVETHHKLGLAIVASEDYPASARRAVQLEMNVVTGVAATLKGAFDTWKVAKTEFAAGEGTEADVRATLATLEAAIVEAKVPVEHFVKLILEVVNGSSDS